MSAAARNARWTLLLLLPVPRDCARGQKKLARQSSISVSGLVENRNTRLAPGLTLNDLVPAPANVAAFRGLPGPGGFNSLRQMSFRQRNRLAPCGPSASRTPLCSWGFALPPGAPPGRELRRCSLALPSFTVLMGFKPSPFSSSPCGRFPFSTFSPFGEGEGCFSLILPAPLPQSPSSLRP